MLCLPTAAAEAFEEATDAGVVKIDTMDRTDSKEIGPGAKVAAGAPAAVVVAAVDRAKGVNKVVLVEGRCSIVKVFTGRNLTRHIYQECREGNQRCIRPSKLSSLRSN